VIQHLANGLYPIDYFVQGGVDQIQYPNEFWWQSKMRYAKVGQRGQYDTNGTATHEYLEIDLSRVRQVSYLNFSILRAPINITIEYDALSDQDSEHQWVQVTPIDGEPFDDQMHYSAAHRSAWADAEFYFTDSQGNIINTRFIRIGFKRRDVDWPHKDAKPFRWSIMVRGLRPARFINHYGDTRGTLFDSGGPTGELSGAADESDPTHVLMGITAAQYADSTVTNTDWVKQQFGLPFDTTRGTVSPSLMGFSWLFWVEPNQPTQEFIDTPNQDLVTVQWKLFDVTNRTPAVTPIKSGIAKGAVYAEHGWVNVYFDPEDVIPTAMPNTSPIYELWVKSTAVHADAGDGIGPRQIMGKFIQQDQAVTGQALFTGTVNNGDTAIVLESAAYAALLQSGDLIQRVDRVDNPATVDHVIGTSVFLTAPYAGSSTTTEWERVLLIVIGTSAPDYTKSACLRLWADVAENGRDVLGNKYRYATTKDAASAVLDDSQVGWLSEPQPSTDAVESLYFDTRYTDVNGKKQPGVIDAIRIGPRTPGVVMHVYYSDNHGNSITPQNSAQWSQIIWKPIHTTYTLNGDSTITLPTTIRANFVQLEFTKLQPRPIHLPKRPAPPLVTFNRYPTWIENQFENSSVRRTVEDWFSDSVKKGLVKIDVLKFMRNPVREFEYKEREFLAALATNKAFDKDARNSGLINTQTNTFIDPVTASNIKVNTNRMYGSPLTLLTDRNSILGQTIANQTDIRTLSSVREGGFEVSRGIADVSSTRSRVEESFAHLAQTPMWFNRECRHIYKKDKARFGKQAFYVGISHVEFLRKDYTQARDDDLIVENLYDSFQIESNTWVVDKPSRLIQRVGIDSTQSDPGLLTKLLVSYTIDDVTYTDEEVDFYYATQIVDLANQGNTQAINVQVYLMNADGSRGIQYSSGQDYFLDFRTDTDTGLIINTIGIDTNSIRFVVTPVNNTFSAATVIGRAVIGSAEDYHGHALPQFDAATVVGQSALVEADVSHYLDPPTFTPTQISNAISIRQGTANPPTDTLDSVAMHTSFPDVKVIGIWVQWSTLHPSKNTFVMPPAIEKSIEDAVAKNYQIIFRIQTGAAAPSWIYTDGPNPVSKLSLLSTSGPLVPINIPLPWDANLAFHYQSLLNWLATQFSTSDPSGLTAATGVSVGGVRRQKAIYFIPVAMATDLGTEMTIGYGPPSTYSPDPTTTAPATVSGSTLSTDTRQPEAGGPTTFTLAGTVTNYPSTLWLYKIGKELILGTRSGSTVTIHTGGRGFSGSTAAVHNNNDSVFFIATNSYTDTAGTFGSNIAGAQYDRQSWNTGTWLAQGTITQNRNRYNGVNQSPPSAWENNIDMLVNTISIPTGIPACVAYGTAWSDTYSNAALLATKMANKYPLYLLGMTTNYQPGIATTFAGGGLQNTFEGGTNGANVLTTDTFGGDALTLVAPGAGTITYDTTTSAHGTTSIKVTGANNAAFGWTGYPIISNPFYRAYVKFNVLPSPVPISLIHGDNGGIVWQVRLNTTGTLSVSDGGGVVKGTSVTALSPNNWYRLEMSSSATSQLILRIYTSPDSNTITETVTATDSTNAATSEVRFGDPASGQILWFDDVAVNGTTWYGPSSAPIVVPSNVFNGITEASLYEGFSPLPADVLRAHSNAGGAIGVQSADSSKITAFSNPWNRGASQCAFGLLTEEVFTKFNNFQFLEYNSDILSQGKGGVDPNQDNYYYLVDPANATNVQQRLINRGVVQVPTGSRTYGTGIIGTTDNLNAATGADITLETGDFTQFSSKLDTGGILTVEAGNPAFGTYAMHVNRVTAGALGYGQMNVPSTNKRVAGRAYVDIERLPDAVQFILQNVSTTASNIRINSAGTISVSMTGSTSTDIYTIPSVDIGSGAYYRVEWVYDISTTSGKLWIKIFNSSGAAVLSSSNPLWDNSMSAYLITNTATVADISSVRAGCTNTTPTTFEAWMDNISVRWGASVGFIGA